MPPPLFESAGLLPPFTSFGADLEAPGMLQRVVGEVAFARELIMVCGDGAPGASSATALNTVMQLHALRLHHVLFISDSNASCHALRAALPRLACVWSSRLPTSQPPNAGLAVQRFWGFAFYFYNLRKHYLAKMAIELGLNVLQTDTDAAWLANPYPALKGVYRQQQIVAMKDRPMVNAGVFYVQNVRDGDGAAWVLRELSRRIHLFMFHPEAVARYVPWARPPFFANVDEQTLMNDCVRSAIANVTSYAQATAGWEVKWRSSGTRQNRTFSWKSTPEFELLRWLDRAVVANRRTETLPTPGNLTGLCAPIIVRDVVSHPLHAVGSAAAPSASFARAPDWLFMSFPSSSSAHYIRRCSSPMARDRPMLGGRDGNTSATAVAARAGGVPFVMGAQPTLWRPCCGASDSPAACAPNPSRLRQSVVRQNPPAH
jgi:hypothetical protein